MNKNDGGCRRIILVEMGDYADSITAERVKRVINGYGEGKNAVAGTGGNFSFYDLGEPLLVGDCLNEAVAPEKIREYIWFMETKQPYAPPIGDNPYYLGKHNSTGSVSYTHLAQDPAAAVNTPKLVYSYKEAVEAVGYSDDFENFTLCQSISACFQVFNVAPIILVNVLDPNKAAHVTQNQAESCDVVDGVVLYDKKYVLLNTLAVKNGSATLVAGSDYEAAHEDDGSVAITLLSTAAKEASSLTVSSTSLKPSGVTAADIVGGVDASTGKETGLELILSLIHI